MQVTRSYKAAGFDLPNHREGHRFFNPYAGNVSRSLWDVLKWKFGRYTNPKDRLPPPKKFSFPQEPYPEPGFSGPSLCWINHDTFSIRCLERTVLTDPIWSRYAACFPGLGPRRRIPPGIPFNDLPPVHVILISHNHYDHLDLSTVRRLQDRYPQATFCVPLGLKKWFTHRVISRVVELDWLESVTLWDQEASIVVTAIPAQHWSGRGIFDRCRSLWCGYIVDFCSNHTVHRRVAYLGDTGYDPNLFTQIGERFGPVDLSLIPIGAYAPRAFMQPVHLNPEEAVRVHTELRSKLSIAGHFGTFRLSDEPLSRPPYDLFLALRDAGIDWRHFRVLEPGRAISW